MTEPGRRDQAREAPARRPRGRHIDAIRDAFDDAHERDHAGRSVPSPGRGLPPDRRDRSRAVRELLAAEQERPSRRTELTAIWVGLAFVALVVFIVVALHLFT